MAPVYNISSVKIRIGSTQAAGYSIHGKFHAFAIVQDPISNQQYITRGGPALTGSGYGFGPILAQSGVWSESLAFDKPSQTVYVQDVVTVNMTYGEVVKRMHGYASSVNGKNLNYCPTGPNSNSYAFSFVESIGLGRPSPALDAPS